MRTTTTIVATVLAAAALATGAAGCSSEPTPSPTATRSAAPGVVFADADVTFLQEMYPHHAQAVQMAGMVAGRSTNRAVLDLAATIASEQQPEMDTISRLLANFGKPAPSDAMPAGGMPGMMSDADMAALGGLSGTAFDQRWLTMMIAHHQGAVAMAEADLAAGTNPDARSLATAIVGAQQSEITQMQELLAG